MSEQSIQNPTPTVQVKEVGLPEQASVGKVLLVAGVAAGTVAGITSLLTQKDETPLSKTDSAKEYLRTALDEAQKNDLGKQSRKQRKRAEKALKKQRAKSAKDADRLVKQGRKATAESADAVRKEVTSIMDSVRSGNLDLDRVVENFAESQLMKKLREFGDEAKVIAEQGKIKGEEAAHHFQDDILPEAKKSAKEARKAGQQRLQDDILPEAKKSAEEARKLGKEKFEEVSERARKDYIPEAQKQATEFADQARETAEHFGEDAEKFLNETSEKAEKKRKEATKAVQKGGRETRSLLLWLSLAGILIFTVFLDEDQQKKLKEVSFEVFGEARDMYSDMKGDTTS